MGAIILIAKNCRSAKHGEDDEPLLFGARVGGLRSKCSVGKFLIAMKRVKVDGHRHLVYNNNSTITTIAAV
jgi:hypothetical protein